MFFNKGFNLYTAMMAENVENGIEALKENGTENLKNHVKMVSNLRKLIKTVNEQSMILMGKFHNELTETLLDSGPVLIDNDGASVKTDILTRAIKIHDRGLLISFICDNKETIPSDKDSTRRRFFTKLTGEHNYEFLLGIVDFLYHTEVPKPDLTFAFLPKVIYRSKVEKLGSILEEIEGIYHVGKINTLESMCKIYYINSKLEYLYREISNFPQDYKYWKYLEKNKFNEYLGLLAKIKELSKEHL